MSIRTLLLFGRGGRSSSAGLTRSINAEIPIIEDPYDCGYDIVEGGATYTSDQKNGRGVRSSAPRSVELYAMDEVDGTTIIAPTLSPII
ncbi:uncharacterized protein STEHIDRAFT_151979 [Stereum hirsutum FP-91666 SS1]|uniref:uncharacterized protein n=1 Tax=Stereum hirsutum (strain FP-91666) TaxID=721885 RepID=UPI000440FD21|nr:uncharacterized protein STEHIDRAFT_151979 [Stereum hirsutum FP-91666 SS1]EIM92667.1 hypothetical protein STEHIDRAFT_151979 [Stereum hirsutum FP-91666 SS1]